MTGYTETQLKNDFRNVWAFLSGKWTCMLLCEPKAEAHEVAPKLAAITKAPVLVLSAMCPAPYSRF